MEEKKESSRVRMTKRLLRSALTQLLLEKPIQNITVRELCERAQINRGTFYLHYTDIYALMESIEGDMVRELQKVLAALEVQGSSAEALVAPCRGIFHFLKENSDMCTILLGKNSDDKFVYRLVDMGKEYSLQKYMECYPKAGRRQAEYFYSFVASGYIGLLRQWQLNHFQDSEEMMTVMTRQLILSAGTALEHSIETFKGCENDDRQ